VQALGARAQISLTPSLGFSTDMTYDEWHSDKYNNPTVGVSKKLNGSTAIDAGISGSFRYTFSLGPITLTPVDLELGFNGNAGSITCTNFTHDWSKPPDERWSGSWALSSSLTASSFRVFRFPGIEQLGVTGVELRAGLDGSMTVSINRSATVDKADLGFTTGDVGIPLNARISYSDGTRTETGTRLNVPFLSNFSYSVPIYHRKLLNE